MLVDMDTKTPNPTFQQVRSCLSFVIVTLFATLALAIWLIPATEEEGSASDSLVTLPTVTPSPAPTSTPWPTTTPDLDAIYMDAMERWMGDAVTWVDRWEPLFALVPDSREWADGWSAIVRDGNTLDGRLHRLPVHAGRTNMHGAITSTFEACLQSAIAFRDGEIAGGRIFMSTCSVGFNMVTLKIEAER